MAATADKDILKRITEAVKAVTWKNASLMMKLSHSMNLNIEMAKKLKIKPTQDPEERKLSDRVKRKAASEKKLYPVGYCWTHRFWVTKRHSIQTCSVTAAGHQRAATRKNIMGGSKARK